MKKTLIMLLPVALLFVATSLPLTASADNIETVTKTGTRPTVTSTDTNGTIHYSDGSTVRNGIQYDSSGTAVAGMRFDTSGTMISYQDTDGTWVDVSDNGPCSTDASGNVTGPASCNPGASTSCTSDSSAPAGTTCVNGSVTRPTSCSNASSSSAAGGIGSQLIGSALNSLCKSGQTCSALKTGLSGNVGGAVSSLCGGGQACGMVGSILNNSAIGQQINSFTSGLMSKASGYINQAFDKLSSSISSAFSSGASSAVSTGASTAASTGASTAASTGASTGASAGGSTASALAVVPVGMPIDTPLITLTVTQAASSVTDNATGIAKTTHTYLKSLDDASQTQLQVTCVLQPMVQTAKKSILSRIAQMAVQYANTGRDNGPIYYTGPAQDTQRHDTIANYFINLAGTLVSSEIASQVQQRMATQYANDNSLKQQLYCSIPNAEACRKDFSQCPGSTPQAQWNVQLQIQSVQTQCTRTGALATMQGAMGGRTGASDQETQQSLARSGGYYDNITCTNSSMTKAQCYALGMYTVTGPGIDQQQTTHEAVHAGQTTNENASQINSLVEDLFSQLAVQALTSGLQSLSQSLNGSSSYVSQLASESSSATASQTASSLQNTIESAMGVEASYGTIISENITNLTAAQTAEKTVGDCYLALATSTSATLNNATALSKANFATSTIATVIAPQITAQNALLASSEKTLVQLDNLDNLVQSADTTSAVSSVSTAYQALVSSGALHTASDVASAGDDQAASVTTLNTLTTNAKTSLAECKSGQ